MSLHVTSVWWSKITLTNVQLFFYCCDEIGRYCCKSLSLWWEKLFAFVYTINNHFKSILGPYKCQVTNIFWSFALNPIEGLQSRCPTPPPPAPKLRISQLPPPLVNIRFPPLGRRGEFPPPPHPLLPFGKPWLFFLLSWKRWLFF